MCHLNDLRRGRYLLLRENRNNLVLTLELETVEGEQGDGDIQPFAPVHERLREAGGDQKETDLLGGINRVGLVETRKGLDMR